MALFHLSVTQTKRSAGQSAIASAAYRAGERLYSEYYGEYSDYTRKGGVICSDILLPSHAPKEYADRQTLSLCFMKGDFIMQDKATNPGKTSRPEKNPLDAKTTYHIGNRSFVVEPVFKEESPDTLGSVLLRLMKSESEKL